MLSLWAVDSTTILQNLTVKIGFNKFLEETIWCNLGLTLKKLIQSIIYTDKTWLHCSRWFVNKWKESCWVDFCCCFNKHKRDYAKLVCNWCRTRGLYPPLVPRRRRDHPSLRYLPPFHYFNQSYLVISFFVNYSVCPDEILVGSFLWRCIINMLCTIIS